MNSVLQVFYNIEAFSQSVKEYQKVRNASKTYPEMKVLDAIVKLFEQAEQNKTIADEWLVLNPDEVRVELFKYYYTY